MGTRDGAKLYGTGSTSIAVAGSTLVFGPSPAIVAAALDRHAHGGGITAAQFTRETAGLDTSSLGQLFGDLTAVLSRPSAASARRVPWVAALRATAPQSLPPPAASRSASTSTTTDGTLTSTQLPFASGSTAPTLAGNGPISVGIHDPAQIVSFVEAAAQQTPIRGT